jgi:hypothetical protein
MQRNAGTEGSLPLAPAGLPWVPLASQKEKMGSTFKERRVV